MDSFDWIFNFRLLSTFGNFKSTARNSIRIRIIPFNSSIIIIHGKYNDLLTTLPHFDIGYATSKYMKNGSTPKVVDNQKSGK